MKELKLVAKISICTYEELSIQEKKLIDAAKNATKNAYAPYSGFHVGAAVLLENDVIVTGNNQENAAFPAGICAERAAIFYANTNYATSVPLMLAIAASKNGKFTEHFVSPCGLCRQVLIETEKRYKQHLKILMYGEKEIYIASSVEDLLPLGFIF